MQHVMVSLQLYNVDRQQSILDQLFVNISTSTFQEICTNDIVQFGLHERFIIEFFIALYFQLVTASLDVRHSHSWNLGITPHNERITNQIHH